MFVKIKRIENGKLPAYKRTGDVCMDCYARTFNIIPAFGRKLIPLGFALELPMDYEAVIRPRSGNSKDGIDVCLHHCKRFAETMAIRRAYGLSPFRTLRWNLALDAVLFEIFRLKKGVLKMFLKSP